MSLARLPVPPFAQYDHYITSLQLFDKKASLRAIIYSMNADQGGQSSYGSDSERQRLAAAELARQKVLAAYSSTVNNISPRQSTRNTLIQNSANQVSRDYARTQNFASITNTTEDANYSRSEIYTPKSSQTDRSRNSIIKRRPPVYTNVPKRTKRFDLSKIFKKKNTIDAQPSHDIQNSQTAPIENTATRTTQSYVVPNSATLKDTPINQTAINEEWQKYHTAWQDYYKKYYSEYYAKAAQNYLETEKMKTERIASGKVARARNLRRLIPVGIMALIILTALFLQYNRLIFAPVMAYISPNTGEVTSSITAVDPTVNGTVSADPRLIIPKLNVDVPVAFGISVSEVDKAMNRGVAQFAIPGANALPGQIGNLAISGHSAGDIYSSNPYKFIFSGLERLENGDLIYINYESVRYTYQVTGSEVVDPSNVDALIYGTDKPMLTLITCTPLGTSKYRLLVSAEQISPEYSADNTSADNPIDDTTIDMPANEPSFFESLWSNIFGN